MEIDLFQVIGVITPALANDRGKRAVLNLFPHGFTLIYPFQSTGRFALAPGFDMMEPLIEVSNQEYK
jgi:hypothetical protein